MDIFQKKEIGYWAAGLGFSIIILISIFFSVRFIGAELNIALNANLLKKPEIAKFNLDQIDKLGIRRIE